MAVVCSRCSRANPGEAAYCYFDGVPLPGRNAAGPMKAGAVPFPHPFLFPNGTACRDFNQFAMGCQQNWEAARDFLAKGIWASFFHGLGRGDLAAAAQRAASNLDRDYALHELLGQLPGDGLPRPTLSLEPTEMNLGQAKPGADRKLELALVNQGMRLLYGTVESDVDWLTVGEGTGAKRVAFRTPGLAHLPVRLVGNKLRASAKPLVGTIKVESNGGSHEIEVRVDVPVKPYPSGLFAGATTPREVARRAKAQPKEAAAPFERNEVASWYRDNGWDYPVEGPAGSGLGAIQQFFEALGLTKAPKVDVSPHFLRVSAEEGATLRLNVEARTQENRPVFAHATSSEEWAKVGTPQFGGAVVVVPLEVTVPHRPGETVSALVTVRANGKQRFLVPLTIEVQGTKAPPPAPQAKEDGAAFGMGRMVYWSAVLGGWSAFVGWISAEASVGDPSRGYASLAAMAAAVGGAIGAGLTFVAGLASRQWTGQLSRTAVGFLGGAVAGAVGILLGNAMYSLFGGGPFASLGRVLGWTAMGAAIGASEGVLRRDRVKLRNGLIGGVLGGLLGGLLFEPVSTLVASPLSSRAIGFVTVGLCVGGFIGLVQVLLKEAWLTVTEGFRPGRQLILGAEAAALGTSEKAQLIFIAAGAKGIEPLHLTIAPAPGGFCVRDNQSRTGTFVNGERVSGERRLRDGDVVRFGANAVRFNERAKRRD